MKKIPALFLCLLLLTVTVSSYAATFTTNTGAFSVDYPDDWEEYYDDSEDTEDYIRLVWLSGPEDDSLIMQIEMADYNTQGYKDYSLYSATEDELAEYIDVLVNQFDSMEGQYLEVKTCGSYNIPFIILYGVDSYGEFLYAETMTAGWTIGIYGYAYNVNDTESCRDLRLADYDQFCDILETFQPK